MAMRFLTLVGVFVCGLLTFVGAVNIEGRIYLPAATDDEAPMSPFQVVLDGGVRSTLSTADGHFVFHDVVPGRYTVDVYTPLYMFSQFKVDISADENIRVLEFKYPGTGKLPVSHPLVVEAHGKIQYFQPRERLSIMDLVRNPSFLALVVPIVMVWLLPKLSEGMMDPEEYKRAQDEMGTSDPQQMLRGIFGGAEAKDAEDSD
uniref:Secreted protein n=1 Tax=Thraustotheca clavata TaxID=74557 RepID=A0A0A7CLR8_9STRA|nr:secreted protein [Thraustotheca clavata]